MNLNQKQILKTFFDLVRIDSPSGKEEKVREYLKQYLSDLNIKSKEDKYGNLIAKISGQGEPIILAAHMDTVQPGEGVKPFIKGDIIKSEGEKILGADNKAGITEIIESIKHLKENQINHRPIELIFTREEEVGLKGALNLKRSEYKAKEALVLDGSGKPFTICHAAPYISTIEIEIKGKSAHAGVEPEKGINAIAVASKAINKIKWGRIDNETTSNIGIIQAGRVRNSVPDKAEIKAEARSHKLPKLEKQIIKIKKAFEESAQKFNAKIKFKNELECHGYSLPTNDSLIKTLSETAKENKMKTYFEKSGGASDANRLAGKGFKVVNVSYGGSGCHTEKETIRLSEITKMTQFLIKYLQKI